MKNAIEYAGRSFGCGETWLLWQAANERGWHFYCSRRTPEERYIAEAYRGQSLVQSISSSRSSWDAISQMFTECIIPWEAEHAAREQKADAVLAQIVNFVSRGAKVQKAIDATTKKAEHAK